VTKKLRNVNHCLLQFQTGDKFKDINSHTVDQFPKRGIFKGQLDNKKTGFFDNMGV
jgi:hypothetical protein